LRYFPIFSGRFPTWYCYLAWHISTQQLLCIPISSIDVGNRSMRDLNRVIRRLVSQKAKSYSAAAIVGLPIGCGRDLERSKTKIVMLSIILNMDPSTFPSCYFVSLITVYLSTIISSPTVIIYWTHCRLCLPAVRHFGFSGHSSGINTLAFLFTFYLDSEANGARTSVFFCLCHWSLNW
jgi:hypothetical protein